MSELTFSLADMICLRAQAAALGGIFLFHRSPNDSVSGFHLQCRSVSFHEELRFFCFTRLYPS